MRMEFEIDNVTREYLKELHKVLGDLHDTQHKVVALTGLIKSRLKLDDPKVVESIIKHFEQVEEAKDILKKAQNN